MIRPNWTVGFAAFALFCGVASEGAAQPRLTIRNQCVDDVWAVLTAGGAPNQPGVQAISAGWFHDNYATQERFIPLSVTGTIAAGSQTLTLAKAPTDRQYFVKDQIVKVVGAGPSGTDLVTSILSVDPTDTVLTLAKSAQTVQSNTDVLVDSWVGAVLIKSNEAMSFPAIPRGGAPSENFRFFMGCPNKNTDPFNLAGCTIGSYGSGSLPGINSLFEASFGCEKGATCVINPANGQPVVAEDFFNMSAVDGYTLPLKIEVTGTCKAQSAKGPPVKGTKTFDGSMLDLASCPREDSGTLFSTDPAQQAAIAKGFGLLTTDAAGDYKACASPHKWFEVAGVGNPVNPNPTPTSSCSGGRCNSVSYYTGAGCDTTNENTLRLACPNHSGPQQRVGPQQNGRFAIQNTSYVLQLEQLGYEGYTWQYDDGVGLQQCTAGAAVTVTLCPGSNKTPYQRAEWRFNPATGECRVAKSADKNFYDSLADCQQANMRYVCKDLTAIDPYGAPGALWSANAAATQAQPQRGHTYAQFWNMKKLHCPEGGIQLYNVSPDFQKKKVSFPMCYYYYGGKDSMGKPILCPPNSSL